ncbi:MAG: hypothetical protein ACLP4V_03825 [Methylocella sp.]
MIAPAMSTRPVCAKRVNKRKIPKTPAKMAKDTGSATNQKIFEAVKNMQCPEKRLMTYKVGRFAPILVAFPQSVPRKTISRF